MRRAATLRRGRPPGLDPRGPRSSTAARAQLVGAAVLFCLWGALPVAAARAHGLQIAAIPPASDGRLEVLLDVEEASLQASLGRSPASGRFRAVTTEGKARVAAVHPFSSSGAGVYTVLAFDHSGSFRRHWHDAIGLANGFADHLPANGVDRVRVLTFGLRLEDRGMASNSMDLKILLATLSAEQPRQVATRLKSFIKDGARLAVETRPHASKGALQLIVFTDAGEESDGYDVQTLIREARDLGVRIHVVGLYRKDRQGDAIASRMDEMKQLAEGSGGRYIQVDETTAALQALGALAQVGERLLWLELAFCGIPPGRGYFQDQLRVEVLRDGSRIGWSPQVAFRQDGSGRALASCPCIPACLLGETCVASRCVAATRPPAPPPAPQGQPASTAGPPPAAPPLQLPLWPLVLLAAPALATLIWWMHRRSRASRQGPRVVAPFPSQETTDQRREVRGETFVAPMATPWINPLEQQLPSTRLVITKGPPALAPVHRLTKQDFVVGALPGQVDLFVDLPEISGVHATFQLFRSGAIFVRDEGSTNGTFVDGRRLTRGERIQLRPGQTVALGSKVELRIEQGSAEVLAPIPPQEERPGPKAKTIFAPAKSRDGGGSDDP